MEFDIKSLIDAIVNAFYDAFVFIIRHPQYIAAILVIVIVYAVASHFFFRVKGYQPQQKTICTLSIAGKERSLDYLKTFTHMTQEQIAIIQYLREKESASRSALSKRFGKQNVDILIRQEYIYLT